jgi:hypothetical protein
MYPEVESYTSTLSAIEREYSSRLWAALQDEIGSPWPEHTGFGVSFHHSLKHSLKIAASSNTTTA